jgi:multidrug efflux pump subunit AcrB
LGRVSRGIDRARNGYASVVTRLVRVSIFGLLAVVVFTVGIFGMAAITPTGFLPSEDQGGFFISIQLPDGASVSRTSAVVGQMEKAVLKMPGVADTFAIVGFSILDSSQESNSGFMFARLKPFADRTSTETGVDALIKRVFGVGAGIRSAMVVAINLPPIIGLATTGGFEYQMDALEGQDPSSINSTMGGLIAAAHKNRNIGQVFSTFTASNPSLYLDIDREKAQALGLNMSDVFAALQATLGGIFINDFNLYGRVWQVNIEGEAFDRSDIPSLWQIYIRNKTGEMVPLRSIADLRIVLGPQVITRYNNYRSVTINGAPAPGVSSGQSISAMASVSAHALPPGYAYEWTGTAYQEVAAAGQTGTILALAVLFAYLFRGRVRLHAGHRAGGPHARPVCADRPRRADCAGGQERHPDRRIRQGPARGRPADRRGRHCRRAHAVPRGDDDLLRVYPGPGAAGDRHGGGGDQPA